MSWYLLLAIFVFIGVLSFAITVVVKYSHKRKLSAKQKQSLQKHFGKIQKIQNNPKEQIIDYDKLYHKVLQAYGYEGTFGEILKQEPNEIGDIQSVWDLHKLRNKLVHEFDLLSISTLKKKVAAYEKELKYLLR